MGQPTIFERADKFAADCSTWLDAHISTKKFLNALVIALIGAVLLVQAQITDKIPVWSQGIIAVVFAGLLALQNWLKWNSTLPLVGTAAK